MRYRWDEFLIDLDAYTLVRGAGPVSLEPKAFNLLALMVQRPGHLFSKQELFDRVWPDVAVTDHALTRVVAQLRRALGDEAREARYIETVPTRGYRWIRPVEPVESSGTASDVLAPVPAAAVTDSIESPPGAAAPAAYASALAEAMATRRNVPVAIAVAMLVVAGVSLLAWMTRSASSTAPEAGVSSGSGPGGGSDPAHDVRWPVQVTTHRGLDLQPALSPSGDALAFVSDRSGALEIYVRALQNAGAEVALTSDGAQNVQPAWSPDGQLIAYHSYRAGGIWVMPSRGGVARQVAPSGSNPAWSPDGQRIAFQSDEHVDVTPSAFGAQSGSTILVVDADGSNRRELTRPGQPLGGHAMPAWSPDARYLAFTVFDAGKESELWLLALTSGEATRVDAGQGLYELAFAPDGSAIYAVGGVDALLRRLPFDAKTGTVPGRGDVIPVPGVPTARGLTISIDGRRVAFAGLALDSQIWAQPVDAEGAAAGPARPFTVDTSRRTSMPAVSPDGTKVAYMSMRRGEPPNVWVMDVDGRNRMQVTSDEAGDGDPRWFPDGGRLVYWSNRDNTNGVWQVDIATRREELLVEPNRRTASVERVSQVRPPSEMQVSPSVTQMAFAVVAPPFGRRVLYVSPTDRFAARAVTDGSSSVGYPAWSPDERRLAVEIKDGPSTHAAVLDLATSTLRQLTHARGQTWVRSWSPDGRRIAAAAARDGVWSLLALDATTGAQRTITPATPPSVYLRYPDWSPRGDLVFFERGELRGNIWLLNLR